MTMPWPDDDVILYDGVCVFCSRWIRFVAARDAHRRFRFTAIQSVYGRRLAQAFGIDPEDPDTNAVVHGGMAFFRSDAALTVLSHLPGWRWVRVLRAVPKAWRDAVYDLVARNRYGIFGKYEACFVPAAEFRARSSNNHFAAMASRAARAPESLAPCAVEKKFGEVASPANNSRASTGAASTARSPAWPGSAWE
jgi:predicted DCC family thiol-disulfide oxidoreductase YuxK